MTNGIVVSDLHLFASRSSAIHHIEEIEQAASNSDFFIFNGDTFDFRWSTHSTVPESVSHALEWLNGFTSKFPNCQIYFVAGNHDSIPIFTKGLDIIAEQNQNFCWHPYYIRLNQCLFLHGDIVHRKQFTNDALEVYRDKFREERRKHFMHHFLYKLLISSRFHRLVFLANPKNRVCSRVLRYLENEADQHIDQISDIYFGHTHVPFSNYEFSSYLFHNTGSSIQGLRFSPLPVSLKNGDTSKKNSI